MPYFATSYKRLKLDDSDDSDNSSDSEPYSDEDYGSYSLL